jgi:hypothetical protein
MGMLAQQQQQQQQQHPGSLLELLGQQEQAAWPQGNGHMAACATMPAGQQQQAHMAAGPASFLNPGALPLQLPDAGSTSVGRLASPCQPGACPDSAPARMGPPSLPAWATAAAAAGSGGPQVKPEAALGGRAPRARRNSASTGTSRAPPRPSLSEGQLGLAAKGSDGGKGAGPVQLTVSAEELADTVPGWNSMTVMQVGAV